MLKFACMDQGHGVIIALIPIGIFLLLHQFVEAAPHPYAERIYSGKLSIQRAKLPLGKEIVLSLLNGST
jgi:hypothetical protein